MKLDKGTVARAIVFVLAWINSFLASKGFKTIPVVDEQTVAMFIAFGVSAYTFYKNNIFGKKGQELKSAIVKESEILVKEAVDHLPKPTVANSDIQPPVQKVEVTVAPTQPTNTTETK